MTDVPKKKQSLAVILNSLTGQGKAKALEMGLDILNADTGLDNLITELDKLFKQDTIDLAYSAYTQFDKYVKTEDTHMLEYILEYERRYHQCEKYEMKLPDAVLSFKLLDGANLSQKERQLVLTAASDRQFQTMKSSLKRIFGESDNSFTSKEGGATGISIKQETAYIAQDRNKSRFHQDKGQKYSRNFDNTHGSTVTKGSNPINKYGKRSRCIICQSTCHWAKACPHKDEIEDVKLAEGRDEHLVEENCNITLLTKEIAHNEILMTESFGCAVIDTACTSSVCGKKWYDQYIDSLSPDERNSVSTQESKKIFRFGDGGPVTPLYASTIPAKIGNTSCSINLEVVNADIPLLLSKDAMKRASTVLDIEHDEVFMFGKQIPVEFTSTGHYCVDIRRRQTYNQDDLEKESQEDVLLVKELMDEGQKRKHLEKLHKQFGHASGEKIRSLLENAGNRDADTDRILKTIVEECDICLKFKKESPRPAVGFPLATDFNETVAVDLHELEKGLWYLHIIDEFTRFSAGAIISNKRSSTFVQKFLQQWISVHGAPRRLYSDNGGEFNNQEVRDMCENFNIEVKTTPALSPWSNGLLERHNQTLTNIMLKIKAENRCSWETALSWGLMSKNSLNNTHGFSSYQLVYGRSPNLPSTLTDRPPALEGTTSSKTVGEHISSMYAARKAFTESECSERIRRALRKQIRPYSGKYVTGDKVYYKRHDSLEWKGPATVIGQDGVVVFLRHGGSMVRVHTCRLRKVKDPERPYEEEHGTKEIYQDHGTTDDHMVESHKEQANHIEEDGYEQSQEINPQEKEAETNNPITENGHGKVFLENIKTGHVISYVDEQNGEKLEAKVLGRSGKVNGKKKNWFNLQYNSILGVEGIQQSVDLSRVKDLQLLPQEKPDADENIFVLEEDRWLEAKQEEVNNWKKNAVYKEVDDVGQHCISTRWVCSMKEKDDAVIPKARLVVRGFEDLRRNDVEKESPTCASESLRMILAIFALHGCQDCILTGTTNQERHIYPPS